jgi:hypothetical protein
MGKLLTAFLAIGLAAILVPGAGAQTRTQDSVTITAGPAIAGDFTVVTLTAASGPGGETPSGEVTFIVVISASSLRIAGPVTCLAVSGNTATINIQDSTFGIFTIQVVDNQPDSFDAYPAGRAPTDCSPLPPSGLAGPLQSGDFRVIDAPPLPTSKDQCRNGGWKTFGVFKNQGDCVSFVATGGKNPPANSP